jgi:molybdopterin converting factor small subunit
MLGEELSWDAPPAAAQPRVALLKLQLRAALREAADAEAAEAAIDVEAAVAELRSRLEPLFQERRVSLEATLEAERGRADAEVAAARRAAAVMLAQAAAVPMVAAEEPVVAPVEEPVVVPVEEPVVAPVEEPVVVPVEEPVVVPVVEPVAIESAIEAPPLADIFDVPLVPEVDPGTNDEIRWAAQLPPPVAGSGTNLTIDAEGFARMLATMVAGVVDERLRASGVIPAPQFQQPQFQQVPYQPQPYQYGLPVAPAPAAPVEKRSFWKHAWHADVVLLGISTVIVLVVLAAWLG